MKIARQSTKQDQPTFTSVHVKFGGAHQLKGSFPYCEAAMTAGEIIKKYLIPRIYNLDGEMRSVAQVTMSCSDLLGEDQSVRAYVCEYPIKTNMGYLKFDCCIALDLGWINDYEMAVKIANGVMIELGFACLKEEPEEASDKSMCQSRMHPTDHTIYLASLDDLEKLC